MMNSIIFKPLLISMLFLSALLLSCAAPTGGNLYDRRGIGGDER